MKFRILCAVVSFVLLLAWFVTGIATRDNRFPQSAANAQSASPATLPSPTVGVTDGSVADLSAQIPVGSIATTPGAIRDPLVKLLSKSTRIVSREEPPAKPNERTTSSLYRTNAPRYNVVRVEETLRWFPGRIEPVLSRVAMVGDQVLVKVKGPDFEKNFANLSRRLNVDGKRALHTPGVYLVGTRGIDLDAVPDLAGQLRAQRDLVAVAEPDFLMMTTGVPKDPDLEKQWGLNNVGQAGGISGADVRALEAWDIETGAAGVVVAVVDTGVDYSHADLAENIWTNPGEVPGNGVDDDHNGFVDDIHGWDFTKDTNDPYDENNHGTHVAGVIGARGNNGKGLAGVSWEVSLMPVKFLDKDGVGLTSDAVDAVNYATANGADITCASWSGQGFSTSLQNAFGAASTAGIVTIASAGNEGGDTDLQPSYPAGFDLAGIVSVGASDGADKLAGFSNYGATSVDLVAPGVGIYSTIPNEEYGTFSGTSTAAPLVAGAVALLKASEPELTGGEIKSRLLTTSQAIPGLQDKTASGGRLDVAAALSAAPTRVPVIAGPFKRKGMVGRPFEYTIHAEHGPTSYDATPLPAGLSADTNTGVISGTPLVEGLFYVTLSAANSAGSFSETLELEIAGSGAPEIVSVTTATGTLGSSFSYQILASNSPVTYIATDLPAGLTVNTSSGLISGTPTETGLFRVRIAAMNGAGEGDAVLILSINYPAPVVTSTLSATAIFEKPFYYAITANNAPDSFASVGLPEGLHLNSKFGIISGKPKAIGTFSVAISATNAAGTDSEILTLTVMEQNPETRIFSFSPASAIVGQTLVLTGQGFTDASKVYFTDWRDELQEATFTVISDSELHVVVPDIETFSYLDYVTRITVVSPAGATVMLPGNTRFVHAGESILAQGTKTSYVVENGGALGASTYSGLQVYLKEGAAADAGDAGRHTFYVENGAFANLANSFNNIVFQEPGGVVLFGSGTIGPSARFQRVIEVPQLNPSILSALPRILPVPKISSPTTATAIVGQLFSYTISLSNASSLQGTVFGAVGLPSGLSTDPSTGLISGTPSQSGTFTVTLTASHPNGSGMVTLALKVNGTAAPVITNARPKEGHRGQPFSFSIQATNAPISFGAVGLPAGLNIDPSTGIISGTPTVSGLFRADISASNAEGAGSARLLILIDRVQPRILSFSAATAMRGQSARIFGEGFTDARTLWFLNDMGNPVQSTFTVISDGELQAEIPDVVGSWIKNFACMLVLETPAGATVTVPPDFQSVTSTISPDDNRFYLVHSGGILSGSNAGMFASYLERGALSAAAGIGYHYFLEAGAAVNLSYGGHRIFHEPGALITGTPAFLKMVESLRPSFPSALLRVVPLPKITSATVKTGTVGHPLNYQIHAQSDFSSITTFSALGLPAGLSLNATSGVISGTPLVEGSFDVVLGATNEFGTGSAVLKIILDDPEIPIISTNGQFAVDLGSPFSLPIIASYSPTGYGAIGLPAGLTINELTGVISGMPSATGSFNVTVTATNANGSGSANLSILIGIKPTMITSLPAAAAIGSVADIRGEGFTGTSAVYFTDFTDAFINASFTVVSDTLLRVTVPNASYSFDNKTRILVVTPAGATVTVPPDYTSVTGSVSASSTPFYVVQNGGTLTAVGGVVKGYVRAGGVATGQNGGGQTYFAESGATIALGSGGGCRLVRAAGANVTGFPSSVISVASLRQSIVPLLLIKSVPSITSTRAAQASIGLPFIYTTTATNTPTSFGAQGLPPGLSINPSNGIISGRPVGNDRVYEVVLTAANSSGAGSATLLLTVKDDYKEWKIASFAPLFGGAENPLAQDLADADGDGICNLFEFSTGGKPLDPHSRSMPLSPVAGGAGHQFQYRRLKGNGTGTTESGYTLGTITYTVYITTNLSDWKTGAAHLTQIGSPIDNGDGTETVTVQVNAPASNHFAKLLIKRE